MIFQLKSELQGNFGPFLKIDLQLHAVRAVHASCMLLQNGCCHRVLRGRKPPGERFQLAPALSLQMQAAACSTACKRKIMHAIVFSMRENPRKRDFSSFHAPEGTWPRGARGVREIFLLGPITSRRLDPSPINDSSFDAAFHSLQLSKQKLSYAFKKLPTYRLGT